MFKINNRSPRYINSFRATGLFLYPTKNINNQRLSDVFSDYSKRTVAWNLLRALIYFFYCWRCFWTLGFCIDYSMGTDRYMNENKISFYVATLNKFAIVAPFHVLNFNKYPSVATNFSEHVFKGLCFLIKIVFSKFPTCSWN